MTNVAGDKNSATKKILILASSPAVSEQTGWPVGFWWAELAHPYWEFTQRGYRVDIASPDGGALEADSWSDPRDASGYSAEDLLSLGFLSSPRHAALVANSLPLPAVDTNGYDAVFLVGGQAPMYTFYNDERVHRLVADRVEAGRLTAVVCHAPCVLLKARTSDGQLVVAGRTWTGFANSEEEFAESFVGKPIQPFRIEDEPVGVVADNGERARRQGVRLWGARIVVVLVPRHGRRLSAEPVATLNAVHPLFAYA